MDDSDQDFVELCSKLLKRVRRKPGEAAKQSRTAEQHSSSQASERDKGKRSGKDGDSGARFAATQPVGSGAEQEEDCRGLACASGDAGSSAVPRAAEAPEAGPSGNRDLRAKDKVLLRMQQFKRANPQKMAHSDRIQPTNDGTCTMTAQDQGRETVVSLDSDEVLALQLQQELDREAAEVQTVDLEDGGLFFCQICHRDLSHMTPEGRTQHLNRCLDESEESGPTRPPPSGVPDCPICGKKFKSQKSRSSHLKRCSSDMGIPPAALLQALQRQAQESAVAADTLMQTVSTKRKGPSSSGLPAKKKPRKKKESLDEETLVALALSSSLLEQEKEQQREKETQGRLQMETPVLKWWPDAGKGRGKRTKATVPPPLLLVQDPQVALTRIQERVSALLCNRAPSPSTPTQCPSNLRGWTGAAPLWQKSTLLDGGSMCTSDFYAAELKEFFTTCETVKNTVRAELTLLGTCNKSESPVQGTPGTGSRACNRPSCSQAASCSSAPSTPGTGQLPVGSQALRDLMELAEDGMTLTQYGCTTKVQHLSGFIQEDPEEQGELHVSGFLPETAHKPSDDTCKQALRTVEQRGADTCAQSAALSRLASDLSSMVNNPQLSDMQLQVDSGEVYFAHSFMVYARCPLLAEMVHESGFGVQEEGVPAAQRVLLNDVSGQAVFALLQYLYTGRCSIPASLQPDMQELASRFDLQEMQQLCHLHQEEAAAVGDDAPDSNEEENVNSQTDQAFTELLRSMWNEEDEDDPADSDGGGIEGGQFAGERQADEVMTGDGEIQEEQVNEEELEEIYEFAATQRNKEDVDSVDEEREGSTVFIKLSKPKRGFSEKPLHPNVPPEPVPSLDHSHSCLFSENKEGDPYSFAPSSGPPNACSSQSKQHQSPHKPSSELSGRTALLSSSSLLDDLSDGASPTTSKLPVTGLSPFQVGDQGDGDKEEKAVELDVPLKQENPGAHSICLPLSPDLPSKKEEPELIVLSDSSDEMDVAALSPSKLSPSCSPARNLQSFTGIKSKPNPTSSVAALENKEINRFELSASEPLNCSPEVSWLVPSTPVQPGKSSKSSSTQTKRSMCRTQLFPKGGTSSLSASVFPSPSSPSSRSPHRDFTCTDSPERLKLNRKLLSGSSLDLTVSPKISRDVCAASRASSKQDALHHLQSRPYSSTPLHTDVPQPRPPAALLLHAEVGGQQRARTASESTEKTELGSFHLSPLSNPSDSPSSSSHGVDLNSKRRSQSSSHSQGSAESNSCVEPVMIGVRNEREKREIDCCSEAVSDREEPEAEKEKPGEANAEESMFQQSFMAMDEPPIAFNDSWGLDAFAEANPGCFSLRLEDSTGSRKQEHSPEQGAAPSSASPVSKPPSGQRFQTRDGHGDETSPSPPQSYSPQPSSSLQAHKRSCSTVSPPDSTTQTSPVIDNGLLDSKIWDSWEENEEEVLPLSQRVNPAAQLKTPVSSHSKGRREPVPITPMPSFSDMDTPDLKNKLSRFGVRPLPKRQMILKLREIHQYTHQLASSDSEDEAPFAGGSAQLKPPPSRLTSCAQTGNFKEPKAPEARPTEGHNEEEDTEPLSASQGSNTSSTAASEESERSNPELIVSCDGDSDSDGGISSSQAASRLLDRLQAVRSFILSDSSLYSQILQYQPLVLSQLQQQLKAAGIRLGAAKLVDYLDSQCITFTTAKPGQSAPSRRRGGKTNKGARGASRKKGASSML